MAFDKKINQVRNRGAETLESKKKEKGNFQLLFRFFRVGFGMPSCSVMRLEDTLN